MAMNAAQTASAQLASDWWTALVQGPPLMPLFDPANQNDVADFMQGGANPQPEYVQNPLLIHAAVRFMEVLFSAVNGHNNDADVPRLQTFDVNNLNTFGPNGEVVNLQNQGLFGRLCLIDLPVNHLRTGVNANGVNIPFDTPQEQGMMLGNGMAAYLRGQLNPLPGGHLGANTYATFIRELLVL